VPAASGVILRTALTLAVVLLAAFTAPATGHAAVYAIGLKYYPLLRLDPRVGWAVDLLVNGKPWCRLVLAENGGVRWITRVRVGDETRGWIEVTARALKTRSSAIKARAYVGLTGRYLRLYGLLITGPNNLTRPELLLLELRGATSRPVARVPDCVIHPLTKFLTRLPVSLRVAVLPRVGLIGQRVMIRGELRDGVFGVPIPAPITVVVQGCGLSETITARPDRAGGFQLWVRPKKPGILAIEVRYAGGPLYEPATWRTVCTFRERVRLRLLAKAVDGGRAFELRAVLTDYRGRPVPNARIFLLENGAIVSASALAGWVTGPDGKTPPLRVTPKKSGRFVYVAMFQGGPLMAPAFSNPVTVIVAPSGVAVKGGGGAERKRRLPPLPTVPLPLPAALRSRRGLVPASECGGS